MFSYHVMPYFRRFYRWFPNFEERFTKDKDGLYQPINGHENEVKYRAEMRAKSMKIVTAKRSDAITKKKYERNKKIVEEVATNEARMFSRQVSYNTTNSNNNTSHRNIPGDIKIDIVAPSPTTTPPRNNNNSFFLDNGYRAPSPLPFQQQPDFSEEENLLQNLFAEADKQFYGTITMMQSCNPTSMMQPINPMPVMQSYGASMPMLNSYDPMPTMNSYDPLLNLYPSMPLNNIAQTPMNSNAPNPKYSECFIDRFSGDSIPGVVSNSSSSEGSSSDDSSSDDLSLILDEKWGSDSDIEDCLLLGMDGQ